MVTLVARPIARVRIPKHRRLGLNGPDAKGTSIRTMDLTGQLLNLSEPLHELLLAACRQSGPLQREGRTTGALRGA